MIYVIGDAPDSDRYVRGTFDGFLAWVKPLTEYQLDIETNVTEFYSTKKLITVSFGDDEDNQYVIQLSYLSSEQRVKLKEVLEDPIPMKLAHNGVFEYVVLRFHDIVLSNIYDTMLAEKVIYGGAFSEETSYSLVDTTFRYLNKIISKDEQMTFGNNVLTESKVLYAAGDVKDLQSIRRMQLQTLSHLDQDWVMALENEALLSYGDMTFYGMKLDTIKWRENIAAAEPLIVEAEKKLNAWLIQEPFVTVAKLRGFFSDEDRIQIKWSSPIQRFKLLQKIVPDLPGGSMGVVKKYLKNNANHPSEDLIKEYLIKDFTRLEKLLIDKHRDFLVSEGMLVPGGNVTVNWGSPAQALQILRAVEPRLKSISKEALANTKHEIITDLKEYKDNLKLVSTYGEKFIEKYLEPDGQIRSNYNQIVSTGRVSSARVNLQNIPVKEAVGARYREAFGPPPGFVVVGSDYASQEAVITAYLSKDPVWLRVMETGEDLHSVTSELVFKQEWRNGTEKGCAYYHAHIDEDGVLHPANSHLKCSCKKHKALRQRCKTINYGLLYGLSAIKLALDLKISRREAQALMDSYFLEFPRIKGLITALSNFGIRNGYSLTMAPFFRRRSFPEWKYMVSYIPAHLAGIEFNHVLGEIGRAAGNMAIQGSAADMTKIATVFIRKFIHNNKLQDKVCIVLQVHDEVVTFCEESLAPWWKEQMHKLMEDAAKVFIPSGLLKADTQISAVWTK